MNEPCDGTKGHFDGGSFFAGAIVGAAIFFFAIFVPILATRARPKGNEILWRTETGVTCHVDKLYPKVNCDALLRDLGPRLSAVKVKR